MKYSLDLIVRDEKKRAFSWFGVCFEDIELLENFYKQKIKKIFDVELETQRGFYEKGEKIYIVHSYAYTENHLINCKIFVEEIVKNGSCE